jgi:L-lactate permease
MHALLAAAPIALVVLTMSVWRWRAASAGLLGLSATLVIAVTGFGLGTRSTAGLARRHHPVDDLSGLVHLRAAGASGAFETLKQELTLRTTSSPAGRRSVSPGARARSCARRRSPA